VAIRFVLGLLFVLGLATAWCSQLGGGYYGDISIRQAIDGPEQKPEIAKSAGGCSHSRKQSVALESDSLRGDRGRRVWLDRFLRSSQSVIQWEIIVATQPSHLI
jgi:hypothetical protein